MRRLIYLLAILSLLVCGSLIAQEVTGSGTTSGSTTSCGKLVTGATTEQINETVEGDNASQDGTSGEGQSYGTQTYYEGEASSGQSGQGGQAHDQGQGSYDPSKEGYCEYVANSLVCYQGGKTLHNCVEQSDSEVECP